MKTLIKLSFIAILFPIMGSAQQDYQFTNYMFNGLMYNPAYAGTHDYAQINGLARKQWVGFDGSPLTEMLSFDMPISGQNMGVGAVVSMDQIGVTQNFNVSGNYSYKVKAGNSSFLSFGIKAGISHYTTKFEDLEYWDENDDVYQNNFNGKILPVFGFGMYFYDQSYYVGLSAPRLFNQNTSEALNINVSNGPSLNRFYTLTAGYIAHITEDFDLRPSMLIRYVNGAPLSVDIGSMVMYKKVFWLGANYRYRDCISAIAQYSFKQKFNVGYSYDFTISKLNTYNSGSHELILSYFIGKKADFDNSMF